MLKKMQLATPQVAFYFECFTHALKKKKSVTDYIFRYVPQKNPQIAECGNTEPGSTVV